MRLSVKDDRLLRSWREQRIQRFQFLRLLALAIGLHMRRVVALSLLKQVAHVSVLSIARLRHNLHHPIVVLRVGRNLGWRDRCDCRVVEYPGRLLKRCSKHRCTGGNRLAFVLVLRLAFEQNRLLQIDDEAISITMCVALAGCVLVEEEALVLFFEIVVVAPVAPVNLEQRRHWHRGLRGCRRSRGRGSRPALQSGEARSTWGFGSCSPR